MTATAAGDTTLLVGATGHVGTRLVERLRGRAGVRALARSDRSAALLAAAGFEVARGDLRDPASVRAALEGVRRLFLLTGPAPDQAQLEIAAIDAAEDAGVRHVVNVSTVGVEMGRVARLSQPHADVEARIASSAIAATLLRPDVFMTNLANNVADLRDGRIIMPAGDARFAMVDPRDVADLAALALTAADPPFGAVPIGGPDALDWHEVAARVGAALGRPIVYEAVDPAEFRAARVAAGVPPGLVDGIVELWQRIAAEPVRGAVDTQMRLLGRPARSLDAWLAEQGVAMLTAAEPALAAAPDPTV